MYGLPIDGTMHTRLGLLEPDCLLRAVAYAVASAQRDIDAHQGRLALSEGTTDLPDKSLIVLARYRIAELVVAYTQDPDHSGPRRTISLRIAHSDSRDELEAELRIDGITEKSYVIA